MNIGVVLVTFNRLEKLKIALKSYESQTKIPRHIVVVNNGSDDGTLEYLNEWSQEESRIEKHIINMNTNSGGSGGFYAGMKYAITLPIDWIWVADDDAYPESSALLYLERYYNDLNKEEREKIAALCGAVINKGNIHLQHRNHIKETLFKVKIQHSNLGEYNKKSFNIDLFSYVGSMVSVRALKSAGLTDKDYFIYCDDQEHSLRLRRTGKLVCVPECRIIHDTPGFNSKKFFWGDYYHYRNELLMIRKYYPLKFILRWIKGYYKNIVVDNSILNVEKRLRKSAYFDAIRNKSGIHEIYKPGWKP